MTAGSGSSVCWNLVPEWAAGFRTSSPTSFCVPVVMAGRWGEGSGTREGPHLVKQGWGAAKI